MPAPNSRRAQHKRKRQQQNVKRPPMPLLPPEVDEDEIEISDEDIEFVTQNRQFANVLAGLDTKGITKHVLGLKPDWDGDSLERFYEKKIKDKAPDDAVTVNPADVLPVKNLDGKLEFKRPEKKARVEPQESNEVKPPAAQKLKEERRKKEKRKLEDTKSSEPHEAERANLVPQEELQPFLSAEERRIQMKTQIAQLCTGLLSNPEEGISSLKELLNICNDSDQVISQLAMLSLVAVFKDIIPGYRIRPPTEKELEVQLSKEVRKIRDYESSLLRSYQAYLQKLDKALKQPSNQHTALKCMCGLLEAVPHFNYRDLLLRSVIPFTNMADEGYRNIAGSALISVFKQEGKHGGDATVEAVQLIADFVKQNDCDLHADVLRPFLVLSFDEDLGKSNNRSKGGKEPASQKQKSKREEKKAAKRVASENLKKEVEEELRVASNAPDEEERRKLQTLTLSAVFETYFRVLKTACSASAVGHPLLGISLEGLLRYSHLINVEFLGDLLAVLRKLAEAKTSDQGEGSAPTFTLEERLQCCSAAFKVMKLNMDALTVDLRDFYVQFYNILLDISPDRGSESEKSFASAMQTILCDSRQHDMQRVAAFIKRLASVSLHLGSGTAMSALATIRHLLSRYKQCRSLMENDEAGGGGSITAFHPDGSDPDMSGALSSVLWELTLLAKHFNPEVSKLASQIANAMASEGALYSTLSPTQAISAFSTLTGGFRPAVKAPSTKLIRKKSYAYRSSEQEQQDNEDDGGFQSYYRLLRDIKENHALRKELSRTKSMVQMYSRYKQQRKLTERKKSRKLKQSNCRQLT